MDLSSFLPSITKTGFMIQIFVTISIIVVIIASHFMAYTVDAILWATTIIPLNSNAFSAISIVIVPF